MNEESKKEAPTLDIQNQSDRVVATRSTDGSGFDFEDKVAAWLLLKMLIGEAMPGMNSSLGFRLQSQTRSLKWNIDDLLVTCDSEHEQSHLALSCKSNVQVTGVRIPNDFINDTWNQFTNIDGGPFEQGRDRMALVTRGQNPKFQTAWTEIKRVCTSDDPALALARIQGSNDQKAIFDNIKEVVTELTPTARDEDVLEFVSHLLVIPTDFDLDPSQQLEIAISQCRQVLTGADPSEALTLWETLVNRACDVRLGDGTIDLNQLWHELRNTFKLNDHPNFVSGWQLLDDYTHDHLSKIETTLPSGYSLARTEDGDKLAKAISENQIVVLYGDSGTGKSALAKSILDNQFPDTSHIWLSTDTLNVTLNEVKRSQTNLTYPLSETLKTASNPKNVLVIDSAERINNDLALQVCELIWDIVPEQSTGQPVWRILIIGQTESWSDGRLQNLLGEKKPFQLGIEPVPDKEIQVALRSMPQLSWIATQEDAIAILKNLRALAWVMQAASQFQQEEHNTVWSLPAIADSLWKFWTDNRLSLQGIMMRLAEREASFEHSIGVSELETPDANALQARPPQMPLRITPEGRVEFEHDLAAEWTRFQRLKEISDDTTQWATFADNPLWTGALRMLGQFLLRKTVNDRTAWDIAFEELNTSPQGIGLASDVLLDALCLDPDAESFLTERTELLFANNGMLLNRLLSRFHHIATVPNSQLMLQQPDKSLALYFEALNRIPIISRWPPVIRFLTNYCDQVAELLSPVVAKLCERWLTTMPVELIQGKPMPFRKELAEIALSTARALQVIQGKQVIIIGDDLRKPIYTAALAGAPDIPDEVSAWALEMAQRRPWHADVVNQIVEYQKQKSKEHTERLRTDPEYRARQQQKESIPHYIQSYEELPPWPLGPQQHVENDFCECCTHTRALVPLMTLRPDTAAEVLLALLIEDSPKEEYGEHLSLDDSYGMEYDHDGYPTIYWKSGFYAFLQIAPDIALGALISLVEFCTERWDHVRERHGYKQICIELELPEISTKKFMGNHMVFDWGHENSTHAGQLHCALSALEKWLCDYLDNGTDVTPYIQRLLKDSNSVSILGVLMNVGKYRPVLFEGLLRPLLAHQALYFWDESRLDRIQLGYDAMAWARQGETIFQMARDWWSATYRRVALRGIAMQLVASKPKIATYLAAIIKQWELPENEKSALELRVLQAELDRDNYIEVADGTSGQLQFEYPESLQRDFASYQKATEPTLLTFMLPHQCKQLLERPDELSAEKAEELAGFLNEDLTDVNAEDEKGDQDLARVAVASTLLARARSWLDIHPEIHDSAKAIVQAVITQIGEDSGFLHSRILNNKGELEFVVHAIMHDFINVPTSPDTERAVLRVLTSGNAAALSTLTSLAYTHRETLKDAWWRLLETSILWCALTVLVPRPDETEDMHELWGRWLEWLRNRKLTSTDTTIARIDPLPIALRVKRLQRQRWVREFERKDDQFMVDPGNRRSTGLDIQFLQATFNWLFQTGPDGSEQFEATEIDDRLELLKRLLDFELLPNSDRTENDREGLPSTIGYEILPAIVEIIPRLPIDAATKLWHPLFQLGGNGHYILGHFIDCWLQKVSKYSDLATCAQHWKKMIEYALASTQWTSGRGWFHGERLLCRLLGCGSEISLDQVAEIQSIVLQMKNLYANWADQHLGVEEDNVTYFCGFLSSSTGRLLRIDGLQWIYSSIQQQGVSNLRWYRSGTAEAMTNFLDIILEEDISVLKTIIPARDALLGLIAILVKQQAPAALSLQERAQAMLS